jgi:hypothetical protein
VIEQIDADVCALVGPQSIATRRAGTRQVDAARHSWGCPTGVLCSAWPSGGSGGTPPARRRRVQPAVTGSLAAALGPASQQHQTGTSQRFQGNDLTAHYAANPNATQRRPQDKGHECHPLRIGSRGGWFSPADWGPSSAALDRLLQVAVRLRRSYLSAAKQCGRSCLFDRAL